MITLTNNSLNSVPYWYSPIESFTPTGKELDLYDQNGYDLTEIERLYAQANGVTVQGHRETKHTIKQPWFEQEYKTTGAVFNHSLLFERKGYAGEAREQLTKWAKDCNLFYKLIALKPKWGLDFSMDYVDEQGNVLEVLHWEYDGFEYEEIQEKKLINEYKFLKMDWDDVSKQVLARKEEWYNLDFFGQSAWKCDYIGVERERYKMVAW
jgi:hypothetical protein